MRAPGAFGILILWVLVPPLASPSGPVSSNIVEIVSQGILPSLALACFLLGGFAVLLRWRGLGLERPLPGTARLLWLPGLYILLTAALVAATGLPPLPFVLVLLANMLLVGFSEELMFRGFLYSGLRDRLSLWPAALITSLAFGLVHVLNVGVTGHLRLALLQSASAAMLGLLLLGLRLRMGSLWPAILVHALWNFGLLLLGRDAAPPDPGEPLPLAAQIGPLLFILPLGLYGLVLLRPLAPQGDGLGLPKPQPVATYPWGPRS
jgi:membrane protease YdiL (CAAX protease family)